MNAYIEIIFDDDRKDRLDITRTTISELTDQYYEETDEGHVESLAKGYIVAFKLFRDDELVGYRRLRTPITMGSYDKLDLTWCFHLIWNQT